MQAIMQLDARTAPATFNLVVHYTHVLVSCNPNHNGTYISEDPQGRECVGLV